MSESSGSFSCIWNGTNPNSPISIPSIFPANHSDSESDSIPGSNETYPKFSHNSNSIVSFFPPARSPTDSTENYEIIITNPSITKTSSFSHFFPLPNGPTSFSIPLIFPPIMSETETDGSCSESSQSSRAQFSNSIVSLFPPAGSQTDSSSSKNYEIIIPTDPSISARPNRRVQIATFKDLIKFLKPKSSNSSKSNRTSQKFSHSKKKSVLSFFSTAKSQITKATKDPQLVQQKVEEAIKLAAMKTEVVEKDVEGWLTDVNQLMKEVQALENKVQGNLRFCNDWCPDLIWQYKLFGFVEPSCV